MYHTRFILLFCLINSFCALKGQGILDSIVNQVDADRIEEAEVIKTVYPRYKYLKDSVAVAQLHDSFARDWSQYDSVPSKRNRVEHFSRERNIEYVKAKKRPLIFTAIYLLLLISISVYWMLFRNRFINTLSAGFRGYAYKEKFIDQLNLLDFNTVFMKLISLILYGLVVNLILYRLNWVFIEQLNLQVLAVVLIVILLAIVKYFLGLILAALFQSLDLVKHHFIRNVVYDTVIVFPLLISISLAYFTDNHHITNIFYIVSCGIIALKTVFTFVVFGGFAILQYSNKKLFVIFYLCALEIIPMLLFLRWLSISYL